MTTQGFNTIIFEDQETASRLEPLTHTRPCFDLIAGTTTLLQHLLHNIHTDQYSIMVRKNLEKVTKQRHKECQVNPTTTDQDTIFINGSTKWNHELTKIITKPAPFIAVTEKQIIALKVKQKQAQHMLEEAHQKELLPAKTSVGKKFDLPSNPLIQGPWELVEMNPQLITNHFPTITRDKRRSHIDATRLGRSNDIFVEEGSLLEKPVVLDARQGPIFIGKDSEIQAFTRITGPTYIGRNVILHSAQIGEGCTIMDHSRIGGELDKTIIAQYSNKQHTGYIGHSYIGEWVNLGALTSNSDLKNTYGEIKVNVQGRTVNTGLIKVGCFLADSCKTSIGALIYTGKRIGVASQLHGLTAEDIPSFTIYSKSVNGKAFELNLDSALRTQERMMSRRGVKMTMEEGDLLKQLFNTTQKERLHAKVVQERFNP
ncbi:MAG: hypothetical protein HYU39_06145 [Thaumarchaeota archaeon]|nr:hypothetical protein [Nitrososphaerota archaeon]